MKIDDSELEELKKKCLELYKWYTEKFAFMHEIVINASGVTVKTNSAFVPKSYLQE